MERRRDYDEQNEWKVTRVAGKSRVEEMEIAEALDERGFELQVVGM